MYHLYFPYIDRSNKTLGNQFVSDLGYHSWYNLSIDQRWWYPIAKFASIERHHLAYIRIEFENLASKQYIHRMKG